MPELAEQVRNGLRDGGFVGAFETFEWNTGLGIVVDHVSPRAYKQVAGARLADRIVELTAADPNVAVVVIAHSAGAAVLAFATESLPDDVLLRNTVLLQPSLAARFDLTPLIHRTTGPLLVYTSTRDAFLALGVPLAGPAERGPGLLAAGWRGPLSTNFTGDELQVITWQPEFEASCHRGGHFQVLESAFVSEWIAPRLQP